MMDWRDALFRPRRVAIVGASATPGKAGELFLRNLTSPESGFCGEALAIHPTATALLGVPAFPRLDAAPTPIDLAVVVTPPATVPSVIEDCGRAKVPVAVVISGGFAETGAEGAKLQSRAVEAAKANGVRLVGPNCFGVVDVGRGLNASLAIGLPRKGGISLITQSGAYGMAAYSRSIDEGMGFAKIVALGNKADVDEADMLEFFGRDPETKVVAALLESIGDGRRLFETIAAITETKPVVVLKTGRHAGAQRAAASHTAALATDAKIVEAALRQAGAHVVEDGRTLLDVAAALDRQPPLRGKRIAIVTNSGGTGVELADILEEKGLEVPALSPALQHAVAALLPPHGSPANPIDVTTDWARFPQMYGACVEALLESDEVDAVVPVLLQRSALMPEVCDAIMEAHEKSRVRGAAKPLHVCWAAPKEADANRARLLEAGVPCHSWPVAAATTLAATLATRPANRPSSSFVPSPPFSGIEGWAPTADAFSLLQSAGFPVSAFAMASSAEDAAQKADAMGFPVVLKAERAGLVHKSDAGAVRLGLCDRAAVAEAFDEFDRRLGSGPALVQKQASSGIELMIGARRDPTFGPLVMCGLGGVWVEALDDVSLRLAPIDAEEARIMLGELKGRKVLEGFRGGAAVDPDAVARLVARLSQWFAGASRLEELDLNPIIARGVSLSLVDVRMRVAE